ncbi:MAG TPA: sulfate ABC transporter substrate-binding protein [Verrucomicrobiae bacterium]
MRNWIFKIIGATLALAWLPVASAAEQKLLNVSYDVSREFYAEFNRAFAAAWKDKTGDSVTITQSHGGSSSQSQAVLNGLDADVVTMNQPLDVDALFSNGWLISKNWAARLPNHSVPYNSTIVFVVRKGNPKHIQNWNDLVQPGVSVVIPNPKTSGNGRYSYLAAWGYALKKSAGFRRGEGDLLASSPGGSPVEAGDERQAREFVRELFAHVPVLDTGGRGATLTFADHGIGDVLLTFENEAALVRRNFPDDAFEVVVPPVSILAENPVTWVDRNVERHHTEAVARAYLEFLYSDEGQELAAQFYFRPKSQKALAKYPGRFPSLALFTVNEIAGGWLKARQAHFADGGIFDQITTK